MIQDKDLDMMDLGLDPNSEIDRKFHKIMYEIWNTESLKIKASNPNLPQAEHNQLVYEATMKRFKELTRRGTH